MWNTMWRKRKTRCFRKYVSTATRPVWIGLAISWNRPRESNTGRRSEFAGKYNFPKVDWYRSAKGGERNNGKTGVPHEDCDCTVNDGRGVTRGDETFCSSYCAQAGTNSSDECQRTVLDYRRWSGACVLQ